MNEILTRDPVLFRSYSRRKGDRRETWTEVCQRTIGDIEKLGKLTAEEASLLYRMQLTNKTFVSGRWLWVGGTDWIQVEKNFSGAYNCTSTKITDWDSFGLLMDLAMMGCGTGAVLESNLDQLPIIKNKLEVTVVDTVGEVAKSDRIQETKVKYHPDGTVDMWVGDSRQGWVTSYQKLLELSSDETFADDVIKIAVHVGNVRPKGEMLNGFGGVSNPIKLPEMYTRIANILNKATGRKLTSLECCLLIDEAAVCVVAGNIRRCLPENALVHTNKGLVPIKEIRIGDQVQTPIGFRSVINKFDQGIQPVYEVITNGPLPRATAGHRMAIYTDAKGGMDWRNIKELVPGDRLIHNTKILSGTLTFLPKDFTQNRPQQSRTAKEITIPDLTPEVAWLIGFTHGNGCVSLGTNKHDKPYGCIVWSMNALQIDLLSLLQRKIDAALEQFGLTATHKKVKGENTFTSTCSCIRLAEYFHKYVKQPKTSIQIPNFILQGLTDIRAAYLAGLMDSDGSINNRPPHLVISVYPDFVRQAAVILSSLGIAGRISVTNPEKESWKTKYNLTIPAFKSRYNALIAPFSAKGKLKEGLKMYGFTFSGEMMSKTYNFTQMRSMGFNGGKDVASNYETYIIKSDLKLDIPVTVKGLNNATQIQTYDIEVEEAHCFYCDGYLTHNSAGIRQFHQDDSEAATAKDNLWQQGKDGKWRIDPERDALRMANHTRVFHRKPSLEEVTEAVRKQFNSGEGAIQWAGEALARANADLLFSDRLKSNFLAKYSGGGINAAKGYLSLLYYEKYGKEISDRELLHRSERYGLNPCLHGDTLVKVWNKSLSEKGWTFIPIKQLAESESFTWIVDGQENLCPARFQLTQRNAKVLKLTLENNGVQETIIATPGHSFFKKTQISQERDLWDFSFHSLVRNGAKWERWAVDEMEVGDVLLGPITTKEQWTIVAIEETENADVYCTKVGTTHSFDLMFLHSGNCGEIIGSDYHCNLSEVHLNNIHPDNFQEQRDAFTAAALAVASLLHHRFSVERYQRSREYDPIVGVSFTGLFDFFVKAFGEDWLRWWELGRPQKWNVQDAGETHYYLSDWFAVQEQTYLSEWRKVVEKTIKEYCDRHNLKIPNRATCVQPGGTKSLLTGASPGWHPPFGQYYIRRITFAKNDPVALACLDAGYSVVPGQSDKDENGVLLTDPYDSRVTEWLVEIPVKTQWGLPESNVDPSKFSALAMFDFYMQVQKYWTTHNTSATILFGEDDIEPLATRIYEAIRDDEGYISVALLARFDSNFPRLPFEAIDKQTYDRMVADIANRRKEDDFLASVTKYSQEVAIAPQDFACEGIKCEIKEYLPNLI